MPNCHAETVRFSSPEFSFRGSVLAKTFRVWSQRARQRRDLANLTERERADIGVTSEQVAREAAKPFWRA